MKKSAIALTAILSLGKIIEPRIGRCKGCDVYILADLTTLCSSCRTITKRPKRKGSAMTTVINGGNKIEALGGGEIGKR
jgi:hypothetical protein